MTLAEIARVVSMALAEDAPQGDITSEVLVPEQTRACGPLVSRGDGVLAGMALAEEAFRQVDPEVRFDPKVADGDRVAPGQALALIEGEARSLLRAERIALNFLQRLSGIATLTARYVDAVAGTGAAICDTRKTTPGLRVLERHAVRVGGGRNHRFGLSDAVLVKDNHLVALAARGLSLGSALAEARSRLPHTVTVEVEVDRLDQVEEALAAGADSILLDNFTPGDTRAAVALVAGRVTVLASGGITLETVRAVAEAGVDLIAVGALTHSAPALDIGLDLELGP